MKIKYFLQLIILFLSFVLPLRPANADLSELSARQWAESKGEQILQILAQPNGEEKFAALDDILLNDVDLDHAARFAVGKYWRLMTPEQQVQYVPLFKRYITALYKEYPLNISEGTVRFKVEKTLKEKDKVDVFCRVYVGAVQPPQMQTAEAEETTEFRVLFTLSEKDGQIKVRDLKVEENSLLLAFRERFYRHIHEEDDGEMEWFLEDLSAMVDDAEAPKENN